MTYEAYTEAMRILKQAKEDIRAQRGIGNCQDAIARNRALKALANEEYSLIGEYAKSQLEVL